VSLRVRSQYCGQDRERTNTPRMPLRPSQRVVAQERRVALEVSRPVGAVAVVGPAAAEGHLLAGVVRNPVKYTIRSVHGSSVRRCQLSNRSSNDVIPQWPRTGRTVPVRCATPFVVDAKLLAFSRVRSERQIVGRPSELSHAQLAYHLGHCIWVEASAK
jgi:hypothetical protein